VVHRVSPGRVAVEGATVIGVSALIEGQISIAELGSLIE